MYNTPYTQSTQTIEHLKNSIDDCVSCARLCEQCGAECIRMDMAGMAHCIELCRDCGDFCLLAARLMSRESPYLFQTCHICSKICEACATACEEIEVAHDEAEQSIHIQCAKACHTCADSCREMAKIYESGETNP
jgi:hypothetical protein